MGVTPKKPNLKAGTTENRKQETGNYKLTAAFAAVLEGD